MRGARIGVPRAVFYERAASAGRSIEGCASHPETIRLMEDAIETLKRGGAVVVDPANIPSVTESDPGREHPLLVDL